MDAGISRDRHDGQRAPESYSARQDVPLRAGAALGIDRRGRRVRAAASIRSCSAQELFDLLAMINSVPGQTLNAPTAEDVAMFEPARLARYSNILRQVAIPYRVDQSAPVPEHRAHAGPRRLRAGRRARARWISHSSISRTTTASLAPATRVLGAHAGVRQRHAAPHRTRLVRAGLQRPSRSHGSSASSRTRYSSLIVKVPNRRLTLILLANSDGLTAPFALEAGDVTASIFARTFLRTFVP